MLSIIVLSLFCTQFVVCVKPWEPEAGTGWWLQKHQELLNQTRDHKNQIKAVFLGASVTEYWLREGRSLWDSYYAKHGAANYGIGGDTTSEVLWRIQNKELDGLQPKVILFSCGPGYNTMNSNPAITGPEMLQGLKEIIKELRNKFHSSKLIIVSHTPYNMKPAINTVAKHNNIELKKLTDEKDIFFFDISPQLTNEKGEQLSQMFLSDHLHLSLAGYTVWHNATRPLFEKLIK